jgi:general secretion pathway protein A
VGEAGTGKTTLVRAALHDSTRHRLSVVHVSNPTLTRAEFFEYLASGFGFSAEAARSKTRFLHELEQAIVTRGLENGSLALIVDEAQSLPYELLEEVRLLSNTETSTGRSLAVALVGQPELATRLDDPCLRQLKQRVALRCELTPLSLEETAAYIAERVRIAGGIAHLLFTREAVIAIHARSGGIPRTISVICDNALVNGFAADAKPVGPDVILEVCRDFAIGTGAEATAVAEKPEAAASALPIFGNFTRRWRFSFF